MFEGLTVWESFLLMTKTREIVFRKPERKAVVDASAATPRRGSARQRAPASAREPAVVSASAARLANGVPHNAGARAGELSRPEPAKANGAKLERGEGRARQERDGQTAVAPSPAISTISMT